MGSWRRVDGGDNAPKLWHLIPLIISPFVYMAFGWQVFGGFLIAWVAMLDGFKDWTDFGYMSMRFTGYAAVSVALFDLSVYYILCGFLCGIIYPLGNKFKVKRYTEFAEILTGFVLTFGLFFELRG